MAKPKLNPKNKPGRKPQFSLDGQAALNHFVLEQMHQGRNLSRSEMLKASRAKGWCTQNYSDVAFRALMSLATKLIRQGKPGPITFVMKRPVPSKKGHKPLETYDEERRVAAFKNILRILKANRKGLEKDPLFPQAIFVFCDSLVRWWTGPGAQRVSCPSFPPPLKPFPFPILTVCLHALYSFFLLVIPRRSW